MKKDSIFSRFLNDDSGATAIEYGLIAALIGVGLITGAQVFADSVNGMFTDVDGQMATAFDSPATPPAAP